MDQKYVKLQIVNDENEILKEGEITLNDGDILVANVPPKTTKDSGQKLYEHIKNALSGKIDVLIVSEEVKLSVIKKS